MKIILVDDEYLALKKMERLLQSLEGVNLEPLTVRAFQSPLQALDAAAEDAPDLAFLDIDMPEMTGFELADRLLAMYPGLEVVFVTAYQEFAIKAFEINALDYLLKPIHPDRLAVTMKRVASSPPAGAPTEEGRSVNHMMLCCLKNLHFRSADGKLHSFSWRTLKAPELFAYLIYYRNKTVSKQTLIDLLWPDFNLKRATTQLHTAIYQIRKTIKTSGMDLHIKFQDEGYRLEFGNVTLDIEEWEKICAAPRQWRLKAFQSISPSWISTLGIFWMNTGTGGQNPNRSGPGCSGLTMRRESPNAVLVLNSMRKLSDCIRK